MKERQADEQPAGTPTSAGIETTAEPSAATSTESPVMSEEAYVNVTPSAAHVLVETLFAGTHHQIPRVRYAVIYKLAEGRSGGDIIDVFHYDNDQVSFAIADISGKGNQAAVQAAVIKYGVRTLASNGLTPENVMRGLNRLYLEHTAFENVADSFATAFFGVVDASRRFLYYSNAGHEPVAIIHPDGTAIDLEPTAPIIGVFDAQHHVFKQSVVAVQHDTLLVATTDGVSEARDASGTLYGTERIIGTALANRFESEADIAKALLADVDSFSNASRHDDIAILVSRFL